MIYVRVAITVLSFAAIMAAAERWSVGAITKGELCVIGLMASAALYFYGWRENDGRMD